jgi:glycosyltransferase involved in cell wall biosynthesis
MRSSFERFCMHLAASGNGRCHHHPTLRGGQGQPSGPALPLKGPSSISLRVLLPVLRVSAFQSSYWFFPQEINNSCPFPMRLLYLCDADGGGIAEYAIRQVKALTAAGVEVTFLCRPSFDIKRVCATRILAILPPAGGGKGSAPVRFLRRIRDAREVAHIAAHEVQCGSYDALLIACFAEYFSPFWAGILRRAARNGLRIGTIAHDPVRDFVLGPVWWHRWSVRLAYSFVSYAFVHDETPVDFGGPPPGKVKVHVIPHGPYEVAAPREDRDFLRGRYGLNQMDTVFFTFGQIRNGKNLDRFLRAMAGLPDSVKLLVAGSGGGGSQRPPEFYVKLAEGLGVAHRCIWDLRYIPDAETGDLFAVADYVLLTYSAKFRSASGVLNAAVGCRSKVLASSGPGPLKSVVERYRLGVFVEPDRDEAILQGARELLESDVIPDWEQYERENSWEENAKRVIEAFGG